MRHIRKIFRFVKPYRKLAVLALIMLVIIVIADLAIPRLIARIIDQGIRQNNMAVVLQTSAVMLGISVLNTFMAILNNIYSVRTGESVARDLREALFVKIQQFSHGNLDRYSTGKLMVRLTSDASAIQRLVQISLRIGTRGPLLMVGSIVLMFSTNAALAATMIPVLLAAGVIIVTFSIKMEPLFQLVQQKMDMLNTVLQENIAGARLVKAFVRDDFETRRFEKANDELVDHTVRVMQLMSSMTPITTLFVNLGIVLVIWMGGLRTIQGDMMVGQIVAFTNYLITTLTPLIMLTQLSNVLANGAASAQRIMEVLETEPEILQAPDAISLPPSLVSEVEFKDVHFHYRGNGDFCVLENINLCAKPGETVAILGATGAGKSSLVNLIPRFYDVTNGEVQINNLDVRKLNGDSILEQVGIVPQEPILFTGTIRENIRYGKPDATDDEIIAAAKIAQAHDFIMQFPQGYDTHVEERGANLSGGQKQRISIARALVTRPCILILDDATSSVDVITETRIQHALKEAFQTSANFVVAQRISTVLNADRIIVLDKGQIVAEGKHHDLIESSPIYQEIFDSQLGTNFTAKLDESA